MKLRNKKTGKIEVEKLKAWKRMKDNGCKIVSCDYYGGTNTKGEFIGEICVHIDVPNETDKFLIDLLFGGEEQ